MLDDSAPFALVVDDDAAILMHACDILEAAGFRPLQAFTFNEAVSQLEAHENGITLVFTDVDLGSGKNGFDLAVEVARRQPDVAILVASGGSAPDNGQLPESAVFIRKPFSAEVVHGRLQELLPDGRKPEPLKQKIASREATK